jgi:predicted  nucleic acid-binding Zn-ribbon protein
MKTVLLCAYRINNRKIKVDDFCISGTGILKKKRELNELKAQQKTAKRSVEEAEEEKTSHTQKYKDLKSNLQSLRKTFFSAEKETVKV